MQTVAASRGHIMLAEFWLTWTAFVVFAGIGTQFLFIWPVGSLEHLVVVITLTFYGASIIAMLRTRIEASPTDLVVHGRVRRRRVDLSDVQRLEVAESGDLWSLFIFLAPIGASIWSIALIRSDGSKEYLSPIFGSHRGCSDVVREMRRLMGPEFAPEMATR